MLTIVVLSIGSVVFLYILYKLGTWNYDYFEKKNIKHFKPWPFVGNNYWIINERSIDYILKIYSSFPNEKLVGSFSFLRPTYFIRDLELVRRITVKDFEYFEDRQTFLDQTSDEIFNKTLVIMRGRKWHEMRNSLNPLFTSTKMRQMFELMADYGTKMVQHFTKDSENSSSQIYDIKDVFSLCANDVIATCVFGLQNNSFEDPHNEFSLVRKELLNFHSLKTLLKFLLTRISPTLAKLLKISFFSDSIKKLFYKLIIDTMKIRERENIVRNDMINLLMQLKRGGMKHPLLDEGDDEELPTTEDEGIHIGRQKKTWTDEELIAQCFLFFLGGFDTSSTAMSFLAYELAVNPDVQMRLIKEIDSVRDKLKDNTLTYDILHKMKYLDMVVTESLRKWPPFPFIERFCIKNYSYSNESGFNIEIEEGQIVCLPTYALHMDPQYYSNPEEFNPERFSPENRKNNNMYAYLPFGVGPRNCIGSRFALMTIKTIFYYLLSSFTLEVCEKTQVPLRQKKFSMLIAPEKPIILLLEARKHK